MPNSYFGSIMQRLCDQIWNDVLFDMRILQVPICMQLQWQSMLAPAPAATSAPSRKNS